MSDLISRQAAIDWASKIPVHDLSDGRGLCRVIFAEDFLKALKQLPSAQPERKIGRWIEDSDPGEIIGEHWACSECHMCYGHMNANYLPNYCPNCGAKMEVEHEHSD